MSFIQFIFPFLIFATVVIFMLFWLSDNIFAPGHKKPDYVTPDEYQKTTPVYTSPAGILPPQPESDDWDYQQDLIESLEAENARIQREADDKEAARQRNFARQQAEAELRKREADEQAAGEQSRLEEIDATYEPWFLELAKEKKIPHVMADLQQFEAWLLQIIDLARSKYDNRFPIDALWRDLKQTSGAYPSGRLFFVALSQTMVKNGLIIPHAGGPYPYPIADNARDRIRNKSVMRYALQPPSLVGCEKPQTDDRAEPENFQNWQNPLTIQG